VFKINISREIDPTVDSSTRYDDGRKIMQHAADPPRIFSTSSQLILSYLPIKLLQGPKKRRRRKGVEELEKMNAVNRQLLTLG
jgi:hypothetical protein